MTIKGRTDRRILSVVSDVQCVSVQRYAVDVLMWWWLWEDPRRDILHTNKISLRRLSDLEIFRGEYLSYAL